MYTNINKIIIVLFSTYNNALIAITFPKRTGEISMANMMVQFQVKDFAAWKKVFDDGEQLRKSNGEVSHQIFHDSNDPSSVTTLFKWDSSENAQKFSQSSELRDAQMQAGVLGMPTVHFLYEA